MAQNVLLELSYFEYEVLRTILVDLHTDNSKPMCRSLLMLQCIVFTPSNTYNGKNVKRLLQFQSDSEIKQYENNATKNIAVFYTKRFCFEF